MNRKLLYLLFLVIWLLFFIKGIISIDPDFGWHIRMGELILVKGIPTTDPFSYTMPSFPFVDHEWLINVILFKLYSGIGYTGLSLIFASLVLLALVISIPKKILGFSSSALILAGGIILPFSGVRPQVITWLILSILINVLFKPKIWVRVRFFMPFLFILWANLHGGFAIGIGTLLLFILVNIWASKKVNFIDLFIATTSFLATLVNPYGIRLWGEIWMQITDNTLRFTIVEWLPILFRFDLAYLFMLTISAALVFRYRLKFSLFEKVFFGLLLIMGFTSQRHVPLWLFIALPLLTKSIYFLSEEVKKVQGELRFKKVYLFFLGMCVFVFVFQSGQLLANINKSGEDKFYPKNAINFLKTNNLKGQLFAPYNWGGYLIWKLPEKKVFIDGRMPSWRYVGLNKESNYAYKDYLDILAADKDFEVYFKKYNIDQVLWFSSTDTKNSDFLKYISSFKSFALNKVFNLPEGKTFIGRLEAKGWRKIYQDNVAVVYVRS